MTTEHVGTTNKKRAVCPFFFSVRAVLPALGILFCMLLFFRNPELARVSVLGGLRLAGFKILPAVFPFLVFSDLLTTGTAPPRLLTKGLETLFRMPAAGCTAILLGWLCGFPIGARCSVRALDSGLLTREEAERAVAISSIPSPAFVAGGIGAGMLGNRAAGWFLYASTVFAATVIGAISAHVGRHGGTLLRPTLTPTIPDPFSKRLTDAVRGAALTALNLCAFVVFFAAVTGAVDAVFTRLGAGATPTALVACLLELSGGVATATALPDIRAAMLLCGMAVGWTGLSVQCQIRSVCDGRGLRFGKYVLSKALQAAVCAGTATVWLLLHR